MIIRRSLVSQGKDKLILFILETGMTSMFLLVKPVKQNFSTLRHKYLTHNHLKTSHSL